MISRRVLYLRIENNSHFVLFPSEIMYHNNTIWDKQCREKCVFFQKKSNNVFKNFGKGCNWGFKSGVSCLPAGDESDPLHDDDGEEEPSVAGIFQNLPIFVSPFLRWISNYIISELVKLFRHKNPWTCHVPVQFFKILLLKNKLAISSKLFCFQSLLALQVYEDWKTDSCSK